MNCYKEVAIKEKKKFINSQIPDAILEAFQLKRVSVETIETQEQEFDATPLAQMGVTFATCKDCSSFEDGSCYKYGGICDPEQSGMDCLHSDNIYQVAYDDEDISLDYTLCIPDDKAIDYSHIPLAILQSLPDDCEDKDLLSKVLSKNDQKWTFILKQY